MKEGASTKCDHSLSVTLLLLLSFVQTTLSHDTHSLCCNFILMPGTTPRECHYAVKCSVDDVVFIQFNETEVELSNNMGKTADATNVLTEFNRILISVLGLLNLLLLDMKTETRGDHILQGTMITQCTQGQLTNAFYNLTIDGHPFASFNSISKNWTVYNNDTIRTWKINRELERALRTFSMGDSLQWLNRFSPHREERPRPKVNPQDTTQLSSATQIPRTVNTTPPTSASEHQHTSWILYLLPLIIALII
ncbi:retinoic acid early-inducible protein 1-alpha-like [Meriones unguiculatus]|uniref:retinoic acid early-inducible protein 1-alpha-like n=1 Tax=Meriones unguiculatus TaxID=10047 RepID=UPI00293E47CC|nr:retinoic acid early-inducible protein 1-alpha-like [Meriones unguiculatus]